MNWNLTPKQAVAAQKELAAKVRLIPLSDTVRLVCGLDAAYSKTTDQVFGGAVVVDIQTGEIVEKATATNKSSFPYIPGLLSFREGPILCQVLEKLKCKPDVLLFDGQGIAHPRRLGIASHIGVLLNVPTVGCAKTRLCGTFREPGEKIGRVVRTQDGVKSVYVSPGHLADIDTAAKLVLKAATRYRLPDPIRLADQLVNVIRKRAMNQTV